MSEISDIREAFDAIDTISMSTDDLLSNLRDAVRWRDECGTSAVAIRCEDYALRLWEALDARLSSGSPFPAAWLAWRQPTPPISAVGGAAGGSDWSGGRGGNGNVATVAQGGAGGGAQ